jgi:hypothetical protein
MGETGAHGVRLDHVACLGYCGLGPNAMVDGLPVSMAGEGAVDRRGGPRPEGLRAHPGGAGERRPPPGDKPRVLLRRFDGDVTTLEAARAAGVYSALEKALHGDDPGPGHPGGGRRAAPGTGGRRLPHGAQVPHGGRGRGGRRLRAQVRGGQLRRGRRRLLHRQGAPGAGSPHPTGGAAPGGLRLRAQDAYLYLRFEYPRAFRIMENAIREAQAAGLVGDGILGPTSRAGSTW